MSIARQISEPVYSVANFADYRPSSTAGEYASIGGAVAGEADEPCYGLLAQCGAPEALATAGTERTGGHLAAPDAASDAGSARSSTDPDSFGFGTYGTYSANAQARSGAVADAAHAALSRGRNRESFFRVADRWGMPLSDTIEIIAAFERQQGGSVGVIV